ncbi:hypothetical protein [Burkholderia ubonensis]|nr:hypothetical protein [Burkholderia ubonensis]
MQYDIEQINAQRQADARTLETDNRAAKQGWAVLRRETLKRGAGVR